MAAARPNLVFILAEDMGAWALHCAGNSDIQTPNLDRMAGMGLRFENFFCTSPVCSPARQPLPGRSFAPWLTQPDLPQPAPVVVFDEYGPVRMIRRRDGKLVLRYPDGPDEFFDLARDPDEEHNLYGQPQCEERIAALRREWRPGSTATPTPASMPGRRPSPAPAGTTAQAPMPSPKTAAFPALCMFSANSLFLKAPGSSSETEIPGAF